jgi:hypothetical protein
MMAVPGPKTAAARTAYIVAAAALGVLLLYGAIPRLSAALGVFPWDFIQEYRLGRGLADGYNPYTPEGRARAQITSNPSAIGHPPTTVIWFVPLVKRVDIGTAHVVIGWLTMWVILIELLALFSILKVPAPLASAWLAFAFVLSLSLFAYHMQVGQISAFIAFLIFAAWAAARRGDDVLAGVALALACALKPFPGVIVLLFVLWRRWRVVGAAATVYLGAVVTTVIWIGPSSWVYWFGVQRQIADRWVDSIQNQAISGVVLRMFHPVCGPHGPVVPAAVAITTALTVALIGVASWRALRITAEGRDVAFAAFTVVSVVTSPVTWEHYDVIYILPIAVAAAALVADWRRGGRGRVRAAALLAVLAGVVASWLVDVGVKWHYHSAFHRGARDVHFQLHFFEILNWLPGFVLLGIAGSQMWRAGRSLGGKTGPARHSSRSSTGDARVEVARL